MIELRWLIKKIPLTQTERNFHWGTGMPDYWEKKVLQYRTQSIHYDGGNHEDGYVWSSWQDVPTVEADV